MRKPLILYSAIIIAFLSAAAYLFLRSSAKKESPGSCRLVWGVATSPTAINPLLTTTSISMTLQGLIFNGLVRLNAKGQIEPDLAERWEVSADGLTYTFYLRQGVRFHDGAEFTADDVKFTFEWLRDPALSSPLQKFYASIKEVHVVSPYTVSFLLFQAEPFFLFTLVNEIVPAHLLSGTDIRTSSFGYRPVGTGPFKLGAWDPETSRIELIANPDYYEGSPHLDAIEVRVYPDSEAVWSALMRQEIDYAGFIDRSRFELLVHDPAFKTFAFASDVYYMLSYNLDDPVTGELAVRRAIDCAFDRREMVDAVFGGYAELYLGPFSYSVEGAGAQAVYDPLYAQQLLREAGWKDADNNGILEKDGRGLLLNVAVDERDRTAQELTKYMRQQLSELGFRLNVILYKDISMLTGFFSKEHSLNVHLKMLVSSFYPEEDCTEWIPQIKREGKLWLSFPCELDALISETKRTDSGSHRDAAYLEIYRIIQENQYASFLFYPQVLHGLSIRFHNVEAFFTRNMPVYTIKDWSCVNEDN